MIIDCEDNPNWKNTPTAAAIVTDKNLSGIETFQKINAFEEVTKDRKRREGKLEFTGCSMLAYIMIPLNCSASQTTRVKWFRQLKFKDFQILMSGFSTSKNTHFPNTSFLIWRGGSLPRNQNISVIYELQLLGLYLAWFLVGSGSALLNSLLSQALPFLTLC